MATPPYLLSTKKGNCTEHTCLFNWEYSLLVYHGPFSPFVPGGRIREISADSVPTTPDNYQL